MGTAADPSVVERAAALLQQGRGQEAAALLQPVHERGGNPVATRLLVRALAAVNDLVAAFDCQRTLVPPDIAGSDAQGRADALAAAQLAQLAMLYDEAAQIAQQLVARDPGDVEAAHLLAILGLWLDGPAAARAALAGVPVESWPPHLLSEVLAFHDDPPQSLLNRTRALAADASLAAAERVRLLLALAQHHDRIGDFDAAWDFAQRGNALARAGRPNDWRGVLEAHLRIYAETPEVGATAGQRQLYLLGTPRSGQSLLQSVLAASPAVASAGERGALLPHLLGGTAQIAQMHAQARTAFFAELAAADRRGLARLFADIGTIVDKSPMHLPVAGSIARIHPAARFAAVVRDPLDTAMSIWLRNFPPAYDYATDLGAIFDHLGFALDAFERWRDAGLTIRLIDHAALVADPCGECAALFGWLDLPWSDDYLRTENRTQPVPTFSAAQVRKPIAPPPTRSPAAYESRLEEFTETIGRLRQRKAALLSDAQ